MMTNEVAVIMGSDSDLSIMQEACKILETFNIKYQINVVSAHRTPEWLFDFAQNAYKKGLKVIIAGAGGAAHLPGMVASITTIPVIGVPIKSSNSIDGWDSILSILQMPNGIPVATVALNGAKNAGILAVSILSTNSEDLSNKLLEFKTNLKDQVLSKNEKLNKLGYKNYKK